MSMNTYSVGHHDRQSSRIPGMTRIEARTPRAAAAAFLQRDHPDATIDDVMRGSYTIELGITVRQTYKGFRSRRIPGFIVVRPVTFR
jgi:hypothetical protein